MADILKGLGPHKVFDYFEKICGIPHGSGNVKAISDFCVDFARKRGLEVFQDEAYNVIIKKPASKGMEQAPAVILQGHLDMVCEKNADVDFDFKTQGLKLGVDGDYIHACGTTLGGDDGIAVAYSLAILDDDTLAHPALEVLFTTEEETGMDGAQYLDCSMLSAKYMINVDSEEEGIITVGCAGGLKSMAAFDVDHMEFSGIGYTLSVTGLLGGHSGAEIHLGRANANKLMGRVLFELRKELPFGLVKINGGLKDNAITRECFAQIVVSQEDCQKAETIVSRMAEDFKNEYRAVDGGVTVGFEKTGSCSDGALTFKTAEKIIYMLLNTPYGVQTMSGDIPGLVESSLNLGVVSTDADRITMTWAVRSSVKSLKWLINDKLQYMTEMLGGTYTYHGDYPEWAYMPDSALRNLAADTFERMYGRKPVINAIHAGLECGLFAQKMPGEDMISIGPDMKDIHTPSERLSISSTNRTYEYICEILENFKTIG